MNNERYQELLSKLNKFMLTSVSEVSPDSVPQRHYVAGGRSSFMGDMVITKDTDLEQLDQNKLLLIHVLLHQIYSSGKNKFLTKEDIEELHFKIKTKISHENFDRLDRYEPNKN